MDWLLMILPLGYLPTRLEMRIWRELKSAGALELNKGAWLFHMLRYVMYDLESKSESAFFRFFYELSTVCNATRFTNEEVISLAEKHYGAPLDWFFKQWICEYGYPEYNVEYKIEEKADGYYIGGAVKTKGVCEAFTMPVVMRVEYEDGSSTFTRENINGTQCSFELGPFEAKPKELVFNELYCVLSKDKVKKL